ncbi:MAG: hypothetical protein PHQ35_09885 [Phycisphaerae bacterium]|nr:hypothetical protein [Phycisphaerae bacterium]MDD5381923.1 hypothetical protein [Phycisphaerae bacterium]
MQFQGFQYFKEIRSKIKDTPFPKAYLGLASPLGFSSNRKRLLYDQLFFNDQVIIPNNMARYYKMDLQDVQDILVPVETHHIFGELKSVRLVNRYLWESDSELLSQLLIFWFGGRVGNLMSKTLFGPRYSPFVFYLKPANSKDLFDEYIKTHLSWASWISEDYLIAALLGINPCLLGTLHEQLQCNFSVVWSSGKTTSHNIVSLTNVAEFEKIKSISRLHKEKDYEKLPLDVLLCESKEKSVNYEDIPLAEYIKLIETKAVRKLREEMWTLSKNKTRKNFSADLEGIKEAKIGYFRNFMKTYPISLNDLAVPAAIDILVWYFKIFEIPVASIGTATLTMRDYLTETIKNGKKVRLKSSIAKLKTELERSLNISKGS